MRESLVITPSLFHFVSIVYIIIYILASRGDFWRDNVCSPCGDLTNLKELEDTSQLKDHGSVCSVLLQSSWFIKLINGRSQVYES